MSSLYSSKFPELKVAGVFLLAFLLTGAQMKPGELFIHEASSYRAEGRRFQQKGDLREALVSYQKAVQADPNYADIYNDLGIVLESLSRSADAETAYQTALRMNPNLVQAHSNLALLYEQQGRLKEAAEHWTERVKKGSLTDPWVQKARAKLVEHQFPVSETVTETAEREKREAKTAQEKEERQRVESKKWKRQEASRPLKKKEEKRQAAAKPVKPPESSATPPGAWLPLGEAAPRTPPAAPAAGASKEAAQWAQQMAREKKQLAQEQRRSEVQRQKELARQKVQEAAQRKKEARKKASLEREISELPKPAVSKSQEREEARRIAMELALEKAQAKIQKSPGTAAPSPSPEKKRSHDQAVQELIQRAQAAMRQGHYNEAMVHYQQALILDPKHPEAIQGLKRAQAALDRSKSPL